LIARDLRWAIRHAARRPAISAAVVATLTLAIAATTVAYSLATSVLWRPLPFTDADRLVFVWETPAGEGPREPFRVTSGRFADWRERTRSFGSVALFGAAGFALDTGDGVVPVRAVRVSPSFFTTLGVSAALGRTFGASDEIPGQHQVVVLSDRFWRERLGRRSDVVGTTIRLGGVPYTVVGVMPPIVFPGWPSNPATVSVDPSQRELWVPIVRTPQFDANMRSHVFGAVARLAPGVSVDSATAELARLATPSSVDPHGGVVTPIRTQLVRDARLPLLALVGAAAALLLVATANLAALQVSTFESRRGELVVRAAIGASAGRLVAQLVVESLLLAFAGGAAGVLAARYVLVRLPERLPAALPFLTPVAVDGVVVAVAVLLATLSGLLIAAWPIAHLLRSGPAPRGVAVRARARVFRVLVTAQVSVTLALVTSAALLLQSMSSVRGADPGFTVNGVATADVSLPASFTTPAAVVAFEDRARQFFSGLAGVREAALSYDHPLEANWTDSFRVEGTTAGAESEISGQAQLRIVSPSYFDALGVEGLSGRTFTDDDGWGRAGVAVVNEAFVHVHGTVIGRKVHSAAPRMTWGPGTPEAFEIVGVVENERFRGLERPSEPAVYLSTRQFPQSGFTLLVSTTADARIVARDMRAGVRAIEPGATVAPPSTLADMLDTQLAARRVTADVVTILAVASLALAALGVYGVLSILVASRRQEIGVRLALGASPGRIARRVVAESLLGALPGLGIGIAFALIAGRLLESVLIGVTSRDPLTLTLVPATMLTTALLAALLPALRAASVDPAIALRRD